MDGAYATGTSFSWVQPEPELPSVYGVNGDVRDLLEDPLPEGVAVRVASTVAWDGAAFVGFTIVRGEHPAQDAVIVSQWYGLGYQDTRLRLVNQSGITPESAAVFLGLWRIKELLEWKLLDVPKPIREVPILVES